MKSFIYTAKDASGALRRGGLEAADRAAALAALKARGLTPISVAEGGAASGGGQGRGPRFVLAAVLAVAAIAAIVLTLPGRRPQAKTAPDVKKGGAVRTAAAPGQAAATAAARAPSEEAPPADAGGAVERAAAPAAPVAAPPPRAAAAKVPPVERPTRVITPGAANSSTNRPRQAFTTGTEQVISWIANSRLGDPPPILPNLPMGEDIGKILDTDIVLYDDDDAKTEAAKTNVAKMKLAMKAFVAEGGDPQDFLKFYQGELQTAHEEWRGGQAELMRVFRESGAEPARAFAEERNRELEARGIKPLFLPPVLRK
ncbi:MAG: hypothetical protein LBW77_06475 [Verrucomicrobiota bacterium]|jgi:hypothetical protein|nr:hypothetical protein [Verrucomicrobiota bacterium]